ncbi:MAG: nucleotidyltransferase family protein [Gemmatimonadaceae bacterium]
MHVSPREKEIVAALSRLPVEPGALERVGQGIGEGIDWDALIEQATRWEVEPAVFGNLRGHFPQAVTPETFAVITERERVARAFALSRTLQVVDLSRAFAGAGIPAMVLKGPALAIQAYGDYSRRTFVDIDLLVSRNDLPRAARLIVERGYTPKFSEQMTGRLVTGQHALEFSGPGPNIEVHWSLLSRHLRFDLGPDELWRDACRLECAGGEIDALSAHHLFIYLCAHGAKHEWMKFRWVCDVAQVGSRLTAAERERVIDLASRTHSKRIVALALRLVREIFGELESPFPGDPFSDGPKLDALTAVAKSRIHGDRGRDAQIVPRRIAALHPYVEPLAFWMASRERQRDKLVCAARFFFEPAASDRPAGVFENLLRPARIAANALMRAVSAS